MQLQGVPLEYRGNLDLTLYIKLRGWESLKFCSSLAMGNETRGIKLLLGAESGPAQSLRCPCVYFRFPALSWLHGAELAAMGPKLPL